MEITLPDTSPYLLEDEYIGDDGLIYCKNCKTLRGEPMPEHTDVPELNGRIQRFMCKCRKDAYEKSQVKTEEDKLRLRQIRCFSEGTYRSMVQWNFDNDDGKNKKILTKCRNYVKHFDGFKANGKGLLLLGNPGTGKTYYAACIANELLNKGIGVKMANFEELSNELFKRTDKNDFIDELVNYSLLIIDDLGIERRSEYMQGNVYEVIDSRYRAGRPMIITTNLTPDDLTKADEIGNVRIYDRILQVCHIIKFDGKSKRRDGFKDDYSQMEAILAKEEENE